MIPQAGSAYAYSYATLGELIAWIIGWDLILEYAVGNIAVAIAWSGYFNSLLIRLRHRPAGLPDARLPHGAPQLRPGSPRAAADGAAHRRHPDPAQHAGGADRAGDHLAALHRRPRERARQQHHGRGQADRARGLRRARARCTSTPPTTRRSRRTAGRGIHQGAAIVFFAYIGFDAISTAAEETKNPQRNMPIGILGGLAICTAHLRHRRHRGDRARAVSAAEGGRSAGARARSRRACRSRAGSSRSARSFR